MPRLIASISRIQHHASVSPVTRVAGHAHFRLRPNRDSMQTIDNRQVTEAKMANARITPLNSAF